MSLSKEKKENLILRDPVHLLRWIVSAAFLLEISLLTFACNAAGPRLSPLLLLTASLVIGIATLFLSRLRSLEVKHLSPLQKTIKPWLLIAVVYLFIVYRFHDLLLRIPLSMTNASRSDIIPQVMVLVHRFLEGSFPYVPIEIWGYSLSPTYLPMQWLPFLIPEWLGVDYRWMAFFIFSLGLFILLLTARKYFRSDGSFLLFALVPLLFSLLYLLYDPLVFSISIESMIAGYYLLFALSIFSLRTLPSALTLLLILLSRFSVVLWIPFYFLALFYSKYRKVALRIAFVVAIGILVIYVLPFLLHDPSIFLNGYRYHSIAALAEWTPGRYSPDAPPYHLYRGYGLAIFFYENVPGELSQRLHILQRTHLIASSLAVLLPAILYFIKKRKYDLRIYLLGSLKIYLAVFYAFIQIPYSYLYIVSAIISLPLLLLAWAPLTERKKEGPV